MNVVRHVGRLLDGRGSSPFELVNDGDLLLLIERMLHHAWRNLSGFCGRWYLVILELRRFFIAISRAVVNRDGSEGTAPDPLVWSVGAPPWRRRLVCAVGDLAMWPGPPAIRTMFLVLRMLLIGPSLLASW